VNGYSSRTPKGYRFLRTCVDLRHVLNDTSQQNEAVIRDAASPVVVLGRAVDTPCTHLNAPTSVQSAPLPDQAFHAKIEVRAPAEAPSGSKLLVDVRVLNDSIVPWRIRGLEDGRYALLAACQWIDEDSHSALTSYDNRFEFPYDLAPGDTASIAAILTTPRKPGPYVIRCDVVQEVVHWFHDLGSPVGEAPLLVTSKSPALEGSLDVADLKQIGGWAWDMDQPNKPLEIDLYDGTMFIAKVTADHFRPDLLDARKGNGAHCFIYPTPSASRSPGRHTIRALVSGRNFELSGSPMTLHLN
jgi:hypothetical protein